MLNLEITADDILRGVRDDPERCAAALAAQRAFPNHRVQVTCFPCFLYVKRGAWVWDWRDSEWESYGGLDLVEFVLRFDQGAGLPCTLRLEKRAGGS